ncbi:MAG: hypothetical protein R3B70_20110 [Polyangiaceae bacterium]
MERSEWERVEGGEGRERRGQREHEGKREEEQRDEEEGMRG